MKRRDHRQRGPRAGVKEHIRQQQGRTGSIVYFEMDLGLLLQQVSYSPRLSLGRGDPGKSLTRKTARLSLQAVRDTFVRGRVQRSSAAGISEERRFFFRFFTENECLESSTVPFAAGLEPNETESLTKPIRSTSPH